MISDLSRSAWNGIKRADAIRFTCVRGSESGETLALPSQGRARQRLSTWLGRRPMWAEGSADEAEFSWRAVVQAVMRQL